MEETYVYRLRNEVCEVRDRLNKLSNFIKSDTYLKLPQEDMSLLAIQSNAMLTYITVLTARLDKAV